ncbi:MAG: hypothetical protein F6K35_43035 [Okeania sp. SIO2H7]|nr:hypothetical protein [Okeania sp. SIO2H7]
MSKNPWFFNSKKDNADSENVVAIHSSDRSDFNKDETIVRRSISHLDEEQSDWTGYFDELESY